MREFGASSGFQTGSVICWRFSLGTDLIFDEVSVTNQVFSYLVMFVLRGLLLFERLMYILFLEDLLTSSATFGLIAECNHWLKSS